MINITILGCRPYKPGSWGYAEAQATLRVFATGEHWGVNVPDGGKEYSLQIPARFSLTEMREYARKTVGEIVYSERDE